MATRVAGTLVREGHFGAGCGYAWGVDGGARKWLLGFLLAGIGLGAWLLSGLPPLTAKTFSPIFLVAIPLAAVGAGAALRSLFGPRRPLVWVRRRFGRSVEDSAIIVWCSLCAAIAGYGISALVPRPLLHARLALLFAFPILGGILGFAGFGTKWTRTRRLLVSSLWTLGAPALFLGIGVLAAFFLALMDPAIPAAAPAVAIGFLLAAWVSMRLHETITGEAVLPRRFLKTRDETSTAWRQVAAILGRAGFRPSGGAWVGPLGAGQATVVERKGRISVQVSGFRRDVSLEAGAAGPTSAMRTGDANFDGQLSVGGEPTVCFAAFVPAAREALLRVLDHFPALRLADGELAAEGEVPAARFLEGLRELAAAAEALGEPGDEGDRILLILRTDPSPAVRARALDLLLNSPVATTKEAARAALADLPGPEVTLAAAFQLGAEGGPHLERLLGPASSQLLRAWALDSIAARCDDATWARAARRGLADPAPDIRSGVLRSMTTRWLADSEELAIAALEDADPHVRATAVRLFVAHELGERQPVLFAKLSDPDTGVRREVIRALGAIGTAKAVERLVPIRTAGGELGRLAADVIREIQVRLPGGERGTLSLSSDDQSGRLSPAVEGGALSPATESGALTLAQQSQAKKLTSS